MFREYDIRGRISPDELNEKSVEIIAKAHGTMLRKRRIKEAVVGHDYRPTSEKFKDVVLQGLTSTGVNCIDLGMILSPMMYSAQYHYKTKGGVIVTGSHNPNDWSGFKQATGFSHTLVPKEMKELYELTVSERFVKGEGEVRKEDFLDVYQADLLKRIKMRRSLKVVINTGNGTAGAIVPQILRKAGCKVIELYTNLDWNFPHYFPNPSLVSMMKDTGNKVKEAEADIGIALDGDGDRLGITDERGQTIWPDRYLIILSRQVLEKLPGAKIIFDVKCTQALEEDIKAHGGKPIMWITGHSYIKAKVAEEKAPLGGEMSGHIFFGKPDFYGFDDGVFAALRLLEYLSHQDKTVSQIIADTPHYESSPTIHVDCADEVKYQLVEKLTQEFKDEGYDVIDINGARVKFKDGWGLVRASSNLPVLVLRFEAQTKEELQKIMDLFKKKFSKYPEIGKEWKSG